MVEIRPACEADLKQIAEIEKQCFSLPWDEDMLRIQLGREYVFPVAADGETILGYVGMQYVLDEGYISNVAVSPHHRRKGIANMLLDALHLETEKLSLSFVSLEVRASNAPAIALYKKHGYVEEGRRKNYYQKPREDAIIMTRRWENEI